MFTYVTFTCMKPYLSSVPLLPYKKTAKKKVKTEKRLSLIQYGRTSTPDQTLAGLGLRAYPLLLQAAVLSGSNAGSDVVKPASSFVIRNRQISCSMWCLMYEAR